MLPNNDIFWPPLTIICIDCRKFGREVMVGTTTIRQIQKFSYVSKEEKQKKHHEVMRKRAEQKEKLEKLKVELELKGSITPEGISHSGDNCSDD